MSKKSRTKTKQNANSLCSPLIASVFIYGYVIRIKRKRIQKNIHNSKENYENSVIIFNFYLLGILKDICKEYFARMYLCEGQKWDLEHEVRKRDFEVLP